MTAGNGVVLPLTPSVDTPELGRSIQKGVYVAHTPRFRREAVLLYRWGRRGCGSPCVSSAAARKATLPQQRRNNRLNVSDTLDTLSLLPVTVCEGIRSLSN